LRTKRYIVREIYAALIDFSALNTT